MFATPFEAALVNLVGYYPPGSFNHIPREEALRTLKALSGEDFGDDWKAWGEWGFSNGKFLPLRDKVHFMGVLEEFALLRDKASNNSEPRTGVSQ